MTKTKYKARIICRNCATQSDFIADFGTDILSKPAGLHTFSTRGLWHGNEKISCPACGSYYVEKVL